MKLTKPARVGGTVFREGVDESLVIKRAQREYDMHKPPGCYECGEGNIFNLLSINDEYYCKECADLAGLT